MLDYVGPGGAPSIIESVRTVLFVGKWMQGGEVGIHGDELRVIRPGKPKLVDAVEYLKAPKEARAGAGDDDGAGAEESALPKLQPPPPLDCRILVADDDEKNRENIYEILSEALEQEMATAEAATEGNDRLQLAIAIGYGGRWDIVQAARGQAEEVAAGRLDPGDIDEANFAGRLSLADLPEPDLFIRTGGEHRISNYLLWQLAYTELWFTDVLWPDFDEAALDEAIAYYRGRQRRFGRIAEQADQPDHA